MDPGSGAHRGDAGMDPGSEAYRDDEEEGQNKAKPGSRHLKAHSKWFEHYGLFNNFPDGKGALDNPIPGRR